MRKTKTFLHTISKEWPFFQNGHSKNNVHREHNKYIKGSSCTGGIHLEGAAAALVE